MALYYSHSTPGFFDEAITPNLPEDAVALTKEKYDALMAGQLAGHVIVMVDGVPEVGELPAVVYTWEQIRFKRDNRLSACDWTQLPDVQMDEPAIQAWRDYRQALRDITETFADPSEIVWPTKPE